MTDSTNSDTGASDPDEYEYTEGDFAELDAPVTDTATENTTDTDQTNTEPETESTEGNDGDGVWSDIDNDTRDEQSEPRGEGAEQTSEYNTRDSEDPVNTPKDPNDISVVQDENEVRDAQDPPQTGNKIKDYVYQKSWPGKQRFERSETPILYTNPHYTAYLPRYLSGVILTVAGLLLGVHYLTGRTEAVINDWVPFGMTVQLGAWWVLVCTGITVLGITIFAYAYINKLHTWFIVTNQRTWVRKGVLSKRDYGSLNHENVNNVEEVNPVKLRLFGVGHVQLFTASTDSVELIMHHMEDPSKWAQTVRNQKQSRLRGEANTRRTDSDDDV